MELLVRSAGETDECSLVGHLVRHRLIQIAKSENETLYQKIIAQRDRCVQNFRNTMTNILGR